MYESTGCYSTTNYVSIARIKRTAHKVVESVKVNILTQLTRVLETAFSATLRRTSDLHIRTEHVSGCRLLSSADLQTDVSPQLRVSHFCEFGN